MKLKQFKASCLPFVLFLFILISTGCEKDKLEVKEVKEYLEVRQVMAGDLAGGAMHLTLKPDGNADITPGGDISYRGTYKINGSTIKVKTEEDSYSFEIISETEIKSKEFGTILHLIIQRKFESMIWKNCTQSYNYAQNNLSCDRTGFCRVFQRRL